MVSIKSRTPEELIVVGSAIICLLGQVPFGIYRLLEGDLFVAAIDIFGAAVCLTAIYQVLRYRRVWFFGALMSVAATAGILAIVAARGIENIQFIYPVIVVTYFLLQPRWALLLSIVATFYLFVILYLSLDAVYLSKILLSVIGCSLFAFLFASLRNRQSEQLRLLSTRDSLTGVRNRRSLDDHLEQFTLRAKRQPIEASLIIFDLDNFKQINDGHGHAAGDTVLTRVAKTAAERIRATDQLFRYGGDEFVVLVNDASLKQSVGLAEDLRTRIEAMEAMNGTMLSISLGVASYEAGFSAADWLEKADSGLLKAKNDGRNRVVSDYEFSGP